MNFEIGICAASAEPPGYDDYVVARLRELGLRLVRIDFSPGAREPWRKRFVNRLLSEGFSVCLHLVPPRDQVLDMPGQDAIARWRALLSETFDEFKGRVEIFEIGGVCNRRKWSGFTIRSYMAAWRAAHAEAKTRGVALAGPNVTDFEPIYNFLLLAAMRAGGAPPAVHTDNLFVERAGAPETYDHKIAGRRLAPLLKCDLTRKARILRAIGAGFGVPATWCAHVSWSMRRLARLHADIEAKQADYLSRYILLAAASGALDRVYWGPLIGQREGLIDDGTNEFPDIPHVAFYGKVNGSLEKFRPRPAFHSMRALAGLLAGARFVRRINRARGLHVLEFHDSGGAVFHAVWTDDARRAELSRCYGANVLESARIVSRDGQAFETPPEFITESPMYILWPNGCAAEVNPAADTVMNLRFARLPGVEYAMSVSGAMRGCALSGIKDCRVPPDGLAPGTPASGSGRVLRDSRNKVWTRAPAWENGPAVVVKRCPPPSIPRRIVGFWKPCKAVRSWNGANELLRRGLPTPLPLAVWHNGAGEESFYLCEEFADAWSARDAFTAFSGGATSFKNIDRTAVYAQVAALLQMLHNRGVFFRDLSAGNLLCRRANSEDTALEFAFIDTARARFFPYPLGMRTRIADLVRICHPLNRHERNEFAGRYMALSGGRFALHMRVPFACYDFKHWMKRHIRRKRRIPPPDNTPGIFPAG